MNSSQISNIYKTNKYNTQILLLIVLLINSIKINNIKLFNSFFNIKIKYNTINYYNNVYCKNILLYKKCNLSKIEIDIDYESHIYKSFIYNNKNIKLYYYINNIFNKKNI